MRTLEVISLIYKSVDYLEFIVNNFYQDTSGWDDVEVSLRIVANDPTDNVYHYLQNHNIAYNIYHDPKPNDYYLNRVYRCLNYAAQSSKTDLICFVNSDMAFSEKWLPNLLKFHDKGYLPTSRLVESGKMLSGTHAYSKNFGTHPKNFDNLAWQNFANSFKHPIIKKGGLYGPVIFDTNEFLRSPQYPEGNIYSDGAGTLNGHVIMPADQKLFEIFSDLMHREHVTVFDSLVYHIQEGEKDES